MRMTSSKCVLPPSDGRNQIAIWFNRDLNRNEDSIQTLRDSISTMRFDTDSIKILTIRFKRHAIWLNRNLEVMVEIEYSFSLLTTQSDLIFKCLVMWFTNHWCMPAIIRSLLLSGEALNGEINARKSAAPKMEIPMVTMAGAVQVWTWLTAVMFNIKTN